MAGESGITIDREERDGLHELVRNHLGSIEDFWVALERTKNFAAVERMGKEFAEDFRLLQDIGWSEYDARETYVADHAGARVAKAPLASAGRSGPGPHRAWRRG
jgi:hypothetical protein